MSLFAKTDTPESWAAAVAAAGYRAAYCPVAPKADNNTVNAYATAAHKADIVIAEVGAWSNPLGPDPAAAAAALEKCKTSLALADKIGARCCVNIAGSRGRHRPVPGADGRRHGDGSRGGFPRWLCSRKRR